MSDPTPDPQIPAVDAPDDAEPELYVEQPEAVSYADRDPNEFVYIKNEQLPTLGGPVNLDSLEKVWAGRGWREATDEEIAAHLGQEFQAQSHAANITHAQVDELDREELNALALRRGLDHTMFESNRTGFSALRTAVKATLPG